MSKPSCQVLDEADQMLDMGFAEDMEIILGACKNEHRQTCLFSATMPPWVKSTAAKYMRNPQVIDVVGNNAVKASTDVRHIAIPAHWTSRAATISDVIAMYAGTTGRVIIFCETKLECNDLSVDDGLKYESKALHGDVPQATRETTMEAFRRGKFRVLIATDVAARGLDMIVDLVVQNKPPESRSGRAEVETYVHRSGRTGRAGRKGVCVTLFSPKQRPTLQQIETSTKNKFEWIGAPQPRAILATAAETAAEDALTVSPELRQCFAVPAASLLARMGGDAEKALSAALAVATGYLKMPPARSLLSSADGFATLRYSLPPETGDSIHSFGIVWAALRRAFPEGFTDFGSNSNVRGMQLLADSKGAVFDVKVAAEDETGGSGGTNNPSDKSPVSMKDVERIVAKHDWLTICDTLPPLKEKPGAMSSPGKGGRRGSWGKGGGRKGGGKGKGGKGGGWGGGRGRGRGR